MHCKEEEAANLGQSSAAQKDLHSSLRFILAGGIKKKKSITHLRKFGRKIPSTGGIDGVLFLHIRKETALLHKKKTCSRGHDNTQNVFQLCKLD